MEGYGEVDGLRGGVEVGAEEGEDGGERRLLPSGAT